MVGLHMHVLLTLSSPPPSDSFMTPEVSLRQRHTIKMFQVSRSNIKLNRVQGPWLCMFSVPVRVLVVSLTLKEKGTARRGQEIFTVSLNRHRSKRLWVPR